MQENRIGEIIGSDWDAAASEGVWEAEMLERFNCGKRATSSGILRSRYRKVIQH